MGCNNHQSRYCNYQECHPKKKSNCIQCTSIVYSMTNAAESNEVIAFCHGIYGKLMQMQAYPTGGSGTGEAVVDPLVSQYSLVLSPHNRFLFAVNAGSNSISSFRVHNSGTLDLADVEPSGGIRPNSISIFGDLLYVSNAGNESNNFVSNISGFRVGRDGQLTRICGATYSLSTASAQPSSIIFSPNGRKLVVSELDTNRLSVFGVNKDGTLTGPTVNDSSGAGPFGSFFLSSGILLVSEAGPNALSSYTVNADGTLRVISGSVLNGQLATCWVVASRDEQFAYTSNAGGSGTITTYRIEKNGALSVVDNVISTKMGMGGPLDSGVSKDRNNFYVLNGNQGSISVFCIARSGQLKLLQVLRATKLPIIGAQGLAVL